METGRRVLVSGGWLESSRALADVPACPSILQAMFPMSPSVSGAETCGSCYHAALQRAWIIKSRASWQELDVNMCRFEPWQSRTLYPRFEIADLTPGVLSMTIEAG